MDYPTMAEDVRHTLLRLGLKRVHLVGHSMGGKVAAALALALSATPSSGSLTTAGASVTSPQGFDTGSSSSTSSSISAGIDHMPQTNTDPSALELAAIVELLSLTVMDISPIDYSNEASFIGVFSTLDTVRGEWGGLWLSRCR
jgi:pimeloyl-ACP methyl ester carboxylesterase